MAQRTLSQKRTTTPFYSRAYGGYTLGQMECVRHIIGNPHGAMIFDPMAGKALRFQN